MSNWSVHEKRLEVLERRRELLDLEIETVKATISILRANDRNAELPGVSPAPAAVAKK